MAETTFTKISQRIPPIDYTSRDFAGISTDLLRTIPFFAPEWTDHNLSDFGIVLQRLVAFVGDVLHFYIDRNANEAFLPTAITRRSVINLLRLIDFELRSAVPASVDVTFSIANPLPGDLLIPKGTQVQTSAGAADIERPILFETVEDVYIRMGQLSAVVSAKEGRTISEPVGISTGLPRQKYLLSQSPVIDGTINVYIDEGAGEQLWKQADDFILLGADDQNFVAERDEDDYVTIFFGDNSAGKIPDTGSIIRTEYRIGGGLYGNVGASTITVVNGTFSYEGGSVVVSVTNEKSASGGEDRMSIDEAKVLGPQSLKALNRAVTEEDYKALLELYPGVAKAMVEIGTPACIDQEAADEMRQILQTHTDCTSVLNQLDTLLERLNRTVGCCCVVNVYIALRGGGMPSTVLKEEILAYLDARKMIGTCIQIFDPEYRPVDVTGTVYVAANFDLDRVAMEVNDAIKNYFDLMSDFVGFGQYVYLSDFFHLVDAIPGVDHVDLTEITRRPLVTKELGMVSCDFVKLDLLDTSDNARRIELGDSAKEEVWTVIFTSSNTFTVRGSASGLQQKTGKTMEKYVSDNGEVSFTITCSQPTTKPGDRASFDTTKKSGDNVPIESRQIMEQGKTSLTFVGGSRPQRVCPQ